MCVSAKGRACPVLPWDVCPEPGGKDRRCLLRLCTARSTCPTLAPPRPACALRPRPDVRMRLGHPLSRTSVRSTGARARAPLHPPNAPPPPAPPDLLYCLQTQPPASSPATGGLLPGPPVFHPGPRSTRAARRRVPGDGRADCGSDLAPSRDLGPRARPPSETDSARAPQGLPSPLARVGPGLAPPPPRARSSSKGGKKKGEKIESGRGCSSDPPPYWARPGGGRASRRSGGEAAAIQGGPGLKKKSRQRRRLLREGGPRAACSGRGAAALRPGA